MDSDPGSLHSLQLISFARSVCLWDSQFTHPLVGDNSGHLIGHSVKTVNNALKDLHSTWGTISSHCYLYFPGLRKTFNNDVRGNSPELVSKCN